MSIFFTVKTKWSSLSIFITFILSLFCTLTSYSTVSVYLHKRGGSPSFLCLVKTSKPPGRLQGSFSRCPWIINSYSIWNVLDNPNRLILSPIYFPEYHSKWNDIQLEENSDAFNSSSLQIQFEAYLWNKKVPNRTHVFYKRWLRFLVRLMIGADFFPAHGKHVIGTDLAAFHQFFFQFNHGVQQPSAGFVLVEVKGYPVQ